MSVPDPRLVLCSDASGHPADWVLVVQPDPVHAEAAVTELRAGSTGTPVGSTGSTGVARRILATRPGHGLVLVHLDGVDRFRADGWPGHRAIRRLRGGGRGEVVALTAPHDRAAEALAAAAGIAHVAWSPASASHAGGLSRALDSRHPATTAPAVDPAAEAGFEDWFARTYREPWKPWFEQGCAVVTGGGEAKVQARRLKAALGDQRDGRRLLRELGATLTGEVGGNEVTRVAGALRVLERLARVKAIDAEPYAPRSLRQTAAWLREDPSLAREAGLPDSLVAGLLAVEAEERHRLTCSSKDRGRTPSEVWRIRRDAAITLVVGRRAPTARLRNERLPVFAERIDAALDAVHDAVRDRERNPGGGGPDWGRAPGDAELAA